MANLVSQIAFGNAAITSINRASGAADAGENGLPSPILDTLHTEGADAAAIDQIRQLAIVQDINAVAGQYPSKFASQSFFDDLTQAAAALGAGSSDTSPPTTTASLSGPAGSNGWYTGPVQVTLSVTDPDGAADVASTSYSVDGGPVTAYTAPFTVSGDGTHAVSFFSVDRAGNEEMPHPSVTVTIDTTAPTVAASADPSELWPPNGETVQVSGRMSDAGSGLDPATASSAVVDEYGAVQPSGAVTVAADGSFSFRVGLEARRNGDDRDGRAYALTVRASDLAGNTSSANFVVTVPHDQR